MGDSAFITTVFPGFPCTWLCAGDWLSFCSAVYILTHLTLTVRLCGYTHILHRRGNWGTDMSSNLPSAQQLKRVKSQNLNPGSQAPEFVLWFNMLFCHGQDRFLDTVLSYPLQGYRPFFDITLPEITLAKATRNFTFTKTRSTFFVYLFFFTLTSPFSLNLPVPLPLTIDFPWIFSHFIQYFTLFSFNVKVILNG